MRVTALAALIGAASAQVEHGGKPRASQTLLPADSTPFFAIASCLAYRLTSPVCSRKRRPHGTAPAPSAPT